MGGRAFQGRRSPLRRHGLHRDQCQGLFSFVIESHISCAKLQRSCHNSLWTNLARISRYPGLLGFRRSPSDSALDFWWPKALVKMPAAALASPSSDWVSPRLCRSSGASPRRSAHALNPPARCVNASKESGENTTLPSSGLLGGLS